MIKPVRGRHRFIPALLLGAVAAQAAAADDYQLTFELRLRADNQRADAAIVLKQDRPLLREARFRAPRDRYERFRGDGVIERDGDFVTWVPPDSGGRIEYRVNLDNQRDSGSFDSLVTEDWALFRADDAFPAARARHRAGATSRAQLEVELPGDWSIITPFADAPSGGFLVDNPDRAFDRPTGWLLAGKLGRRKDMIGGLEVSVAAPVGAGAQRLAMLALLRWTLPYLERETDELPPRLSIVSAGSPMWRGGLSAPNSVYIHADRPLLSENATSTLLHEAVHVLLPVTTHREHDWIDEGIAEYVTLRLLRDSGTISLKRFRKAIDGFEKRGRTSIDDLVATHAKGAVRAGAVALFARLDAELVDLTDGETDIYDLIRRIRASGEPVDAEGLREAALALTGGADIESLKPGGAATAPTQTAESDLTK